MKKYKKYIDVVVYISKRGDIKPIFIVFNGEKFKIDRIESIRNAASSLGGAGVLYECRIQNQTRKLFYERDKWFIESTQP